MHSLIFIINNHDAFFFFSTPVLAYAQRTHTSKSTSKVLFLKAVTSMSHSVSQKVRKHAPDSEVKSNSKSFVFISNSSRPPLRAKHISSKKKKHFKKLIEMNPECLQCFQQAFDSLFSRWTALKLAVEHSDDTRKGLQVNKMMKHIHSKCLTITRNHFICNCRLPSKLRVGSSIIAHKTMTYMRVKFVII